MVLPQDPGTYLFAVAEPPQQPKEQIRCAALHSRHAALVVLGGEVTEHEADADHLG